MSRSYSMAVSISEFKKKRKDAIEEACNAEWSFDDWMLSSGGELVGVGESNLCGGETEDEFAERLRDAIWKANGEGCTISVNATYLEDLPCSYYTFDASEYKEKEGKK
jgi:hypothetical protein